MEKTTIFYDGKCELCLRFKLSIEKLDANNNFTFQDIHGTNFEQNYPQLNLDECKKTLHVINDKGEVLIAEDATVEIIKKMPGAKAFMWLIEGKAGKKASKIFYQSLEKIRHSLNNRCPGCK